MPTNFDTNFSDNNNDTILASHVKQYAQPINDLENEVDQLQQDVTNQSTAIGGLQTSLAGKQDALTGPSDVPGLDTALMGKQAQNQKLDEISNLSLAKGDLIVHDGTQVQKLGPGANGQILQSNASVSSGLEWVAPPSGGGGATQLSDLSDVAFPTTRADGQVLQYNGSATRFENRDLASAGIASSGDISGLQSQINNKANSAHTHTVSEISGTLPVAQGGTGATTVSDARVNLDTPSNSDLVAGLSGKSNLGHTHDTSDIVSGALPVVRGGTGSDTPASARTSLDVPSNSDLAAGLAAKEDVSQKGQSGGYAGLNTNAAVPIAQGGTGANTPSDARMNLDAPSNSDLTSGLSGKANLIHTHDASDIVTGSLSVVQGGTGGNTAASARASLDVPSNAEFSSGLVAKQNLSERGQINGYAGLNSNAAVPVAQGGTGLNSLSANRLLGSGSSSNIVQAISMGSGLSLSGGVLSNTSPGLVGSVWQLYNWVGGSAQTISSTTWVNISGYSGTFNVASTSTIVILFASHTIEAVSGKPGNLGAWRIQLSRTGQTTRYYPLSTGSPQASHSYLNAASGFGGTFSLNGLAAGTWTATLQMMAESGQSYLGRSGRTSANLVVMMFD